MTTDCVCHANLLGVALSKRKYSALNCSNSCSYRFCVVNVAGRFRSPKSKEEETSLLSEVTLKATLDGVKESSKNCDVPLL